MRRINETVYEMLMSQGLRQMTAGTVEGAGMKSAGRSYESAAPQGVADSRGGGDCPPIGHASGGTTGPMRISGKGRGPKPAPVNRKTSQISRIEAQNSGFQNNDADNPGTAKGRTDLRIVIDNSRCNPTRTPTRVAPRGVGFHLVLIDGGKR